MQPQIDFDYSSLLAFALERKNNRSYQTANLKSGILTILPNKRVVTLERRLSNLETASDFKGHRLDILKTLGCIPDICRKLKTLHKLYQISYIDWVIDEDNSENDECLDLLYRPSSLEAAIAKYPNQAVRVLFIHLRLIYSKFEEQAKRLKL